MERNAFFKENKMKASARPKYAARGALSSAVKPSKRAIASDEPVTPPPSIEADEKAKRLLEGRSKARVASELALLNWPKPEDVSKLVPSSGQSLMICPSFFPFEREDQKTDAADEGSLLHDACATRDTSRLASEEQVKLVEMCLDYSSELEKDAFSVMKEIKISVYGVSNGYIDLLILRPEKREIHVIDYKFGKWPVTDAADNFQGWLYVEWAFSKYEEAETVTVHFLSPRINEITAHCFTREDVIRIRKTVGDIQLKLTLPPKQRPHNYDPHNCAWCARAYACPAIASLAESVARCYDGENLERLSGELAFLQQRPSEITDTEQMAKAFILMKSLDKWCSSVSEHTKQWLLAGNEMGDYGIELAQKDGNKGIKDEDVPILYKRFVEDEKIIEPEKFLAACSVGVNKLLDAYAEGKENSTRAKAEMLKLIAAEGALVYGNPIYYPQIARDVKKRSKKKE